MKTASATASAKAAKYLAVLALGLSALGPAQAQSSKIAWLSTERIYNESRLAKLAGDKLSEKIDEKLGDKVSPELKNALKGLFKK